MAEIGDAFPRRDLGGSAENWGRHIEQRIVTLESAILQLSDIQGNTARQNSGTSSNVANQMSVANESIATIQLQQLELSGLVDQLGATSYANLTGSRVISKSSSSGAWSSWFYTQPLGAYTARTNQALILGSVNSDPGTLNEFLISCSFGLSTGQEVGGGWEPSGSVWLPNSEASVAGASDERMNVRSMAMGVISTTVGQDYSLRARLQSRDYGLGALTGLPSVNQITMYIMPV